MLGDSARWLSPVQTTYQYGAFIADRAISKSLAHFFPEGISAPLATCLSDAQLDVWTFGMLHYNTPVELFVENYFNKSVKLSVVTGFMNLSPPE